MQVVCIQAHGDHRPGDLVEIPDGAGFSELHFAIPGSPEALTTQAAPPQAPPTADDLSTPALAVPGAAEGSTL